MSEDFFRSAVAFFAVIDPIGNILVFQAIVGTSTARERTAIAVLAVATSFALLALFALAGQGGLDFLGIATPSFQIAAGVLLVLPAIRLVERGEVFDTRDRAATGLDAAVVPLALPMLSGPGALALAITSAGQYGEGVTIAAVAVVLLLTLGVFIAASALAAVLHPTVLRASARVVGVVLMAIAVNFIVLGWQQL